MITLDRPGVETTIREAALDAGSDGCLVCSSAYGPSKLPGLKCCTECGFITADMALSDDELSALYGEDYFHGNEYRNYVSEEVSLKDNFRRRLRTLHELIPDLRERRVFEIGCAYGFFLDEVKGDVAAASGIDISADATRYARDVKHVDAITGNYSDYVTPPGIGFVAMWDTIEHLPRPDLFIEKAAQDIDKGGYIAVTTGDIASLNARMRGKHWRMIHPPTHLHYFSVDTLSKLLDRHGFDVVHVSHPGNARDLRSILHFVLDLRLGWGGLYRRIAGWRIFNMSLSMNLFDIMFIVARRRDT
ncbi:2-polyprenyl-3-methyl-5-hydroxy-6-metoxy-1,4-benzoquinol methylase [Luteibacter sp. UNC138MFCol5.1]|uniref:class I SAM-dependent methyltransferase n=1 Tax=Luteibacter sp. UNC138MFCol5.1 TaxID=1502774 RepID=UPI0008D07171|nr:class I SAM-dependent methyltransferase [Luteibacter sp. UNC138MFCol5.1]SEP05560.1 2-polyprenyl-3-methyl-5-hydroxy-6-metoxy-1,4-benzoquinol methylase [Luteibacter sp. UNC138MFCol5.1]